MYVSVYVQNCIVYCGEFALTCFAHFASSPIKMDALSSSVVANSSLSFLSHRPFGGPHLPTKPRTVRFRSVSAQKDGYGSDFGGGLVDQNMIVLSENGFTTWWWLSATMSHRRIVRIGCVRVCGFGADPLDEQPTRCCYRVGGSNGGERAHFGCLHLGPFGQRCENGTC